MFKKTMTSLACLLVVISCNAMQLQRTPTSYEDIIAKIKKLDDEINRREAAVVIYQNKASLFNKSNEGKEEQKQTEAEKDIQAFRKSATQVIIQGTSYKRLRLFSGRQSFSTEKMGEVELAQLPDAEFHLLYVAVKNGKNGDLEWQMILKNLNKFPKSIHPFILRKAK